MKSDNKQFISEKWIEFFTTPQQPIKNIEAFKDAKHLVRAVTQEVNSILINALNLGLFNTEASFFHFIHTPPVTPIKDVGLLTLPLLMNRNTNNYENSLLLTSIASAFIRHNKFAFTSRATKFVSEKEEGIFFLITTDKSSRIKDIEKFNNFKLKIVQVNEPPKFPEETITEVKNRFPNNIKKEEIDDFFDLYDTLQDIQYNSSDKIYEYIEEYASNNSFSDNEFVSEIWKNTDAGNRFIAAHVCMFKQLAHESKDVYIFFCVPKVHNAGDEIGNVGGIGSVFMFTDFPDINELNKIYAIINHAANAIVKYSVGYSVIPLLENDSSLGIISHHVGKLFQEADVSSLFFYIKELKKYKELDEICFYLKQLDLRLTLIWGIKKSLVFLKSGYLEKWFIENKQNTSKNEIYRHLREICLYVIQGQLILLRKNEELREKVLIEINIDNKKEDVYLSKIIYSDREFPALPPIKDKDITYGITIGLCELIRNACEKLKKSEKLFNCKPTIKIEISEKNNEYQVSVSNFSETRFEFTKNSSIKKIQYIENNIIAIKKERETLAVAKTYIDENKQVETKEGFFIIKGEWNFYYNNLCNLRDEFFKKTSKNHDY